ncbi:MAG: glutamate--tRNA ligase [Patescibacteria group bacterium]|nr:glutamate--tRNA ligase [Patescibacteria group bacterium]MCL5431471.1 glutamate--tRNA ligase [Patescibacteria group bacterium]
MKVRTRFAPSPTGQPHIGHLRTAAYAFALAKHSDGDFIFRIEDTDQKRYVPEAVTSLKNMLTTFNMNWDEYYVQSERLDLYRAAAEELVATGHAFYCNCPGKNAKKDGYSQILRDPCREKKLTVGAIKLKVPDGEKISFRDLVFQKEISWNTDKVFDATLLKSDGFPTYHLAAAVDDHETNISHVLRGYDWMSSTPIHLLVYRYLGYETPEIGHLTDVQSPEGGKLSKRKGSTSISSFLDHGYLPAALLNFIILLGWAPKDNREMFTLDEFVENFNENGFQKANPVFHTEKLDWFNQQYIRKTADTKLVKMLAKFTDKTGAEITKLIPLVKDRLVTLKDFDALTNYFFTAPAPVPGNAAIISHAISVLEKNFDGKFLEEQSRAFCAQKNIKVGDYFMTLRQAVTGQTATPPLWDIMKILGKEETISRLQSAHGQK